MSCVMRCHESAQCPKTSFSVLGFKTFKGRILQKSITFAFHQESERWSIPVPCSGVFMQQNSHHLHRYWVRECKPCQGKAQHFILRTFKRFCLAAVGSFGRSDLSRLTCLTDYIISYPYTSTLCMAQQVEAMYRNPNLVVPVELRVCC